MARLPVKVDPDLKAEAEALRYALAVAAWYFGDNYMKAKHGGRAGRIQIRLNTGDIDVWAYGCIPELSAQASITMALPSSIGLACVNITTHFKGGFSKTGLVGDILKLDKAPDEAEIDGAFRTLKPYLPQQGKQSRYHIIVERASTTEIRVETGVTDPDTALKIARDAAEGVNKVTSASNVTTKVHGPAVIREVREEDQSYPEFI